MTLTRRTAITATAITGLAMTAGLAAAQPAREQHPKIRAAIRALEQAKDEMQHAAHDFGGHRVDAVRACDQAIEQLRLALNYDKK